MKTKTLEKAVILRAGIIAAEVELTQVGYIISDRVTPRESYLSCNGLSSRVHIPKEMFKTVGALLHSHFMAEKAKLEKELEAL